VEGLSTEEFASLASMLRRLNDRGIKAPVEAWLTVRLDGLADCASSDLAMLVSAACQGEIGSLAPVVAAVDAAWEAKLAAGDATAAECRDLSLIWWSAGDRSEAAAWAMRMYELLLGSEGARESVDAAALNSLVGTMHQVGMLDRNTHEYPAFAMAAARLAREGRLDLGAWPTYKHWGMLLSAPESRQALEAVLLDPEGNPRMDVARIVGWSCRLARQEGQWCDFLDGKVQETAGGDARARWLLVRAHAESLRVGYDGPSPLKGRPWLEQAMAAATSRDLRLVALREMVRGHMVLGQYETALAYLDETAGQLSDSEVAALRQEVHEATEAHKLSRYDAKAPVLTGRMERLRSRIAVAQERGDTAAAQELQLQLSAAEAELSRLAQLASPGQ
jgi:hypothetical protein